MNSHKGLTIFFSYGRNNTKEKVDIHFNPFHRMEAVVFRIHLYRFVFAILRVDIENYIHDLMECE